MGEYGGVVVVPVPSQKSWHLIQNGERIVLTKEQAEELINPKFLDGQSWFIKI